MVDYLKLVAEIEEKMAVKSTPPPVKSTAPSPDDTQADTQAPPVESTATGPDEGATDTQQAPDLDAWRREYIEKEQATWTDERRQARDDEIQHIEDYRRRRGPVPPGPQPGGGIPRAESLKAVGEVLDRLGAIWPDSLEPDEAWQAKVWEAERTGNREAFHSVIEDWEASETRRVDAYMSTIHAAVAGWPDDCRRRFALMVKGFRDGNRGMGITVRGLNPNAAMDKAYHELLPYVPSKPDTPPAAASADDFPFTDMHPHTREILLRHWHAWGADRRQRFEQDVRDVMKRTGYCEGNAAAFVLQTAFPVAPAPKPALSPEEKEALRGRMWPTPPSSPSQKTKPAVPGQDIAKMVSRWPKAWRLKYSGLVGKYSNSMPLVEAMERAFSELKSEADK